MNQTQTRSLRKKVLSLILAVVMVVSLLPISAFASGNSKASTTDNTDYYKILHLDCGRKYFSKDWIIALLNEMKADGYNQLQLAFGNDGLRFLLDNMSFTANGTTYSHKTVVSKVEAGNKLQNNSGDARWLTQTEMDEIIAAAKEKGIEIVPLLNLPGHANTILDIADNNTYNAKIYGTVSQNTLDVTNDAACNFGYEIFKKYVDYFSSKGCKYFNFGADEYGNDTGDKNPHFDVLKGTGYENLSAFINKLAAYIGSKNMTPRTFNDALYYNKGSWDMQTTTNTAIKTIQCCYWSSGWGSYPVAEASTIVSNGHAMINTNGAYYYVLGKDDAFTPDETKVHDAGQYTAAAKFDNTAFASGTVNNPVGSMFCIWSDFPNAETETQVAQNVRLVMRAMALRMDDKSIDGMGTGVIQNGFNADGTLNRAATGGDNTYTSEVDINLTVGQTSDVYTQAGDVTGKVNKDGFNETVASIDSLKYANVEGKTERVIGTKQSSFSTSGTTGVITDTAGHYMVIDSSGNITSTDDINAATVFTVKKTSRYDSTYSIQGNGYYLQLTSSGIVANSKSGSSFNYATYNGFYVSSDYYYYRINYSNGSWGTARTTNGDYTGAGQLYSYTESTTPATNATQITFKGNAVGETSVIIGSVKYNITVTAEDLSKVTPLTIEYWITNRQVTADNATSKTVNATDNSIYSEAGVKLSELVPSEGVGEEANSKTVFWKGTRLTTEVGKQNTDKGNDKTTVGDDFTYIRYWESKWAFSADGTKWTAFNSDDQVVAYYLQKTDVTNEVETQVVDWGAKRENYSYNTWVLLDYAVKYESGDRTPDTFPVDSKTLAFHCDYNSTDDINKTVFKDGSTYYRKIGAIRAEESDDYEVYMITVTPTSDTKTTKISTTDSANEVNSYEYKGTEKVVWVDDAANLGAFADKELQYEGFHVGGNATVPGLKIYNRQGMLVTYYVRAKVKTDSLHVHYIDRSANNTEFYNYDIVVGANTSFDAGIGLNQKNWKGPLINGTVTNSLNKQQTVSADLSTMPRIGAQYRYAKYDCVEVTRSENGKDVYLYYTFSNTVSFVIDFGLPLQIPLNSLSTDLNNAVIEKVTISSQGRFGTAAYDETNQVITYTPTKTVDETDTLGISIKGTLTYKDDNGKVVTQNATVTYNVYVIPATSVYYEDSFATFTNANGTTGVDNGTGNGYWVTDGTTVSDAKQALEELGSKQQTKNVYGYDPAYQSCSKFSMGSATKVTVAANTANNGQWPTATFTFKGTGFDVISLTNSDSGTVVYTVTNKSNGVSESHIINNYYGYRYDETTGKWVVANNDSTAPYQVPVIKVSGLAYDTYEVTISVIYGALFDNTNDHQYSFWLDAIRVYDPAGATLNTEYAKDNENAPDYVRIKKVILDSKALETNGATGAVFIDGKGANGVTAADYTNQGPNHEAYLANRQAIAFQLIAKDKPTSVQIGAKLASGNSAGLKIGGAECAKANGGTLTLNTATDMYYELTNMDWQKDGEVYKSNVITLTNAGSGIISLTNLKFIGAEYTGSLPEVKSATSETNLVTLAVSSEMIDEALTTVDGALNPAPETFEPSHFEADWNRSVRAGQKATLTVKTSEDVDAITVDGQTITTYRTRTERTGWGWWSPRVTYRVFTYTTTAQATADYEVCALNSSGVASEPITATLTVKPAINWWHKWF